MTNSPENEKNSSKSLCLKLPLLDKAFLDDEAFVTFALYQLQQKLKRTEHNYSITQIKEALKEALMVYVGRNLQLTDLIEQDLLVFSIFDTIRLQTREDWKRNLSGVSK